MSKEEIKNTKGITLIALVITIIVLLILAGVSIAMLTGQNGILTQAQRAKNETNSAAENEAGRLDEYNNIINNYANGVQIPQAVVPGNYYATDTDVQVGDNTVAIPGGAMVSNIPGEYEDVNEGFVIYITNGEEITDWSNPETIQKTYDQFVWIPVDKDAAIIEEGKEITGNDNAEKYASLQSYITNTSAPTNKYPMAVRKTDGTYSGILYDFEDGTNGVTVTPRDYTTTSSNREPDIVSSYDNSDTYNNGLFTKDTLQSEFKEMIEAVESKGGFWIGRYETSSMSTDSSDSNTVKVVKGSTNGINNVNWYRMYAQQKKYKSLKLTNSANTRSSMIWGSQWSQILIWMKDEPNTSGGYYITNSVGMANFGISGVDDGYSDTSNPAATGCFEVRNIYDLAGNIRDWTLEANSNTDRVLFGGTYSTTSSDNARADSRSNSTPGYADSNYGSRSTLYVTGR